MDKIKIGISTCLLGEKVRYDGGHKLDRYLRDTLGQYFEYIAVCPEVECGMSTPRESMRLVGNPDSPRLVTQKTKIDHTDLMIEWAKLRVKTLEKEDLCGFIFKSKSPSSGMERVRVYNAKGMPSKNGVGLFARIFMEYFPMLPVEEEGRLHDPKLREHFIERVFVFRRWREVLKKKKTRASIINFHTRHKLLIMAHSPKEYKTTGKLLGNIKDYKLSDLYQKYQQLLVEALRLKSTRGKNTNVLMHAVGYFKKQLSSEEKQELSGLIEHYRKGNIPLIVPITLINHYVLKFDQPYLKEQYFLKPHPLELQLHNHV